MNSTATIIAVQPLVDKRILITRTQHQASELAGQLEALGATPILIPAIEIVAPLSYDSLDDALGRLHTFDWIMFTSANAVEIFAQRLGAYHGQFPRVAVIGPATAHAVEAAGFSVDLMPAQYVAESLSAALIPYASGAHMLLVRAAEARDHLTEALTGAGARVTIAEAYRNRIPPESSTAFQRLFSTADLLPDAITFTSASTARNLAGILEAASLVLPSEIVLASIGPITSQALRDIGLCPTVEASAPTIPALVESLIFGFGQKPRSGTPSS